MIDSIVFRLHNKLVNSEVWWYLDRTSVDSVSHYLQRSDSYGLGFKSYSEFDPMVEYGDTGKVVKLQRWSKYRIPSSHYSIAYKIDNVNDFIEFNFSIPKYLYGHNIAQFVTNPFNIRDFSLYQCRVFDNQAKNIHSQIIKVLDLFFAREFGGFVVPHKYLQIMRYDICFNQYFDTKDHALEYLDLCRKKAKKNMRQSSYGQANYPFGISFKTASNYAKIYHKGSDYERHDKKEHIKFNESIVKQIDSLRNSYYSKFDGWIDKKPVDSDEIKKLKSKLIDVDLLQLNADRILRYEVEFKGSLMSAIYKNRVYRKKCPLWKKQLKRYRDVANNCKDGTMVFKTFDEVDDILDLKYNSVNKTNIQDKKNTLRTISKTDEAFFRSMRAKLVKRHKFFLEISDDVFKDSLDSLHSINKSYDEALFSRSLVLECVSNFKDFFNQFQFTELPSIDKAMLLLADYNSTQQRKQDNFKGMNIKVDLDEMGIRKVNDNKILKLMVMLQHYSLDEIKSMDLFSKRTFYRYKSQLSKVLNVTDRSLNTTVHLKPTPLDYTIYYGEVFAKMPFFLNNLWATSEF